ncbi:MAG: acyclic terpene utilization AtuA family protein [Solirubrobacterales bacterium]
MKLGAWAAFWGDTPAAARQVLRVPDLDYLVSDYLAEITMALLARARAKDPASGYVGDAVDALSAVLPELSERGIKVVTNAGALNPAACADALQQAADEAGVALRVAAVEGDDLLARRDEVLAACPRDMFTGEQVPATLSSLNAYLGARPIARALDLGADIVVTGRCVDAAVVLGPLMPELGWSDDDASSARARWRATSSSAAPSAFGDIHTDWQDVRAGTTWAARGGGPPRWRRSSRSPRAPKRLAWCPWAPSPSRSCMRSATRGLRHARGHLRLARRARRPGRPRPRACQRRAGLGADHELQGRGDAR